MTTTRRTPPIVAPGSPAHAAHIAEATREAQERAHDKRRAMKVTVQPITTPQLVDPDILNAAGEVISKARSVLAHRSRSRSNYSNRIPQWVLDELDEAVRKWDALP